MSDCLAVLNAGSSSIKFAVYETPGEARLFRGQIEGIGPAPHLRVVDDSGIVLADRHWAAGELDHAAATQEIFRSVAQFLGTRRLRAVGHRVVHGGTAYAAPVQVDAAVLRDLDALVPLAPLHQPHNLAPIRAIAAQRPDLAQVACFDTAFHRTQAPVVQTFAIPRRYFAAGVRRYGFHGLSYEFVSTALGNLAPGIAAGRVIVAHLGNGASLCAIHHGKSVASTMGFTAVDGLMMGTRCGAIDAGVILYLMQQDGLDARGIEDLIYRRSGLLGVSGISSDMRALRASPTPEAAEAIALFVHRIVREIGSLAAALGGLDALVFTAGIGENDPATREAVMRGCSWLGIIPDLERNAMGRGRISSDGAPVEAWVIATDEERMIARHTTALLRA